MRPKPEYHQGQQGAQGAQGYGTPPGGSAPASAPLAMIDAPTLIRAPQRPRRRRSFVGDITAGLFLGDFARDLGLPGAVTQITVSFIPLVGSTCAVRDLIADLRHRDRIGALLNVLALTPILGGFSKTFEVIRSLSHVGHAAHIAHEQRERARHAHPAASEAGAARQ